MKKSLTIRSLLGAVLIVCAGSILAWGQTIPQTISFQGKLLESGAPVTGTRNFTFTFTGTAWTENP